MKGVIMGIGVTLALLLVFWMGMAVGFQRARFAGQFGDNFQRNFLGQRAFGLPGENLPGGHGAVGEIVSLQLPEAVVAGPDNLERVIVVSSSTEIRRVREKIPSSELQIGEFVVVIGNPNQSGQIEARLIRIMPKPRTEDFNRINKR